MKAIVAWLLLVFACTDLCAQVACNGTLGDPLIKVDFGAGSNLHSANKFKHITTYEYTSINVEDGLYTIKNTTKGDHSSGWYETTDHTGDPGGYMMVVNASIKPQEFYRDTVKGLCTGTTFEFAAWIFNLLKNNGIQPNIRFIIKTAIGADSVDTGPLQNVDPTWRQHGLFFKTPAAAGDVILIMKNIAPGGGGNDLVLDDITFRACGPPVNAIFTTGKLPTLDICVGDSGSFQMKCEPTQPYGSPLYQWQELTTAGWVDIPGANTLSYSATITNAQVGSYSYRMSMVELSNAGSTNCKTYSDIMTLYINNPPSQVVSGRTSFCENENMLLSCDLGESYSWTGPNNFTATTQTININGLKPINSGKYTAVIKKKGCVVTATTDVVVYPIPNADGGSDALLCSGNSVKLQGSGGLTYSWFPARGLSDPSIADPVASPDSTTTYKVTVTGPGGCISSDTVRVTVIHPPLVDAGQDKIIHVGQSIVLDGRATGSKFYWSPATGLNSVDSLRPIAKPISDITYTLFTTTGDPCNYTATDQVFVRVYQNVIIPNAFTPNNDGVNDLWNIGGLATYSTALTEVFNRQGDMVYRSKGYSKPWDGNFNGKALPVGVYYYKINLDTGAPTRSGWVTILR